MYRITVPFGCGHLGEVAVGRRSFELRAKCDLGERLCIDCDQEERRRAPLTGSPKQIAWARKIRAGKMALFAARQPEWARAWRISGDDWAIVAVEAVRRQLSNQGSASWWIEHRYRDPWRLCVELDPRLEPLAESARPV